MKCFLEPLFPHRTRLKQKNKLKDSSISYILAHYTITALWSSCMTTSTSGCQTTKVNTAMTRQLTHKVYSERSLLYKYTLYLLIFYFHRQRLQVPRLIAESSLVLLFRLPQQLLQIFKLLRWLERYRYYSSGIDFMSAAMRWPAEVRGELHWMINLGIGPNIFPLCDSQQKINQFCSS